ncbi:MAG: vitamin K epoxide reductase family protein [Actinomycetota bacterium]|nr:vitamin K epoxide reductase family protein [Actinomycetota bacterium]
MAAQHATRSRPAGPPARQVRPRGGGVGRSSGPAAEAVSDALRRGSSGDLTRRRGVAGLALTAIGSFLAVAAYQHGLVRHLPDPPGRWFDSDAVDASGEAYAAGRMPDAALGIASYAVTLALAGMGDAERAREHPMWPLAMAGKVGLDAVGAVFLTLEQVTKHKRICTYCTAASAATLAMVPLVVPEARRAWVTWRARR